MRGMLRKFTLDLESLRAKVKHELPVVQKSLLANDLHATKLVIESIRQHYSKELEAKRQAVRDAAALRLEVQFLASCGPLRAPSSSESECRLSTSLYSFVNISLQPCTAPLRHKRVWARAQRPGRAMTK